VVPRCRDLIERTRVQEQQLDNGSRDQDKDL